MILNVLTLAATLYVIYINAHEALSRIQRDPLQKFFFKSLDPAQWEQKLKVLGMCQLGMALLTTVSSIPLLLSKMCFSGHFRPGPGVWTLVFVSLMSLIALDVSLAYNLWHILPPTTFTQNALSLVEVGLLGLVPLLLHIALALKERYAASTEKNPQGQVTRKGDQGTLINDGGDFRGSSSAQNILMRNTGYTADDLSTTRSVESSVPTQSHNKVEKRRSTSRSQAVTSTTSEDEADDNESEEECRRRNLEKFESIMEKISEITRDREIEKQKVD